MRKLRSGRRKVKNARLKLALYVAELDLSRDEQCQELFRLSQISDEPLKVVPHRSTIIRWLKEADDRGLTPKDGGAFFQEMMEGQAS